MTPKDQIIAIAEFLGYKWAYYNGRLVLFDSDFWKRCAKWEKPRDPKDYPNIEHSISFVPNFIDRLEEMYKVEEELLKTGYYNRLYVSMLQKIMNQDENEGMLDKREVCDLIHATAQQRAEAILRTIGKWVE